MNIDTNWIHPFEKHGLGKAPFRCVGYRKAQYQAFPGAPIRAGASCDFCGTAIMHTYEILSADGKRFKVGCDCVDRTKDTALVASLRAEERAYERELERQAWEADRPRREAEAAKEKARLQAQADRNAVEAAMLIEGARVALESNLSDYDRSVIAKIHTALTSGTREAGVDMDDEWPILAAAYLAAVQPANRHVGSVGQRLRDLECVYHGGPTIGLGSDYGPSVLAKFTVISGPMAGAILIWKTKYHPARRGQVVRLTASVKEHSEYKGTLQTIVTRGKV